MKLSSTQQCSSGFNHSASTTEVGKPYSQVFLSIHPFSVSNSCPGKNWRLWDFWNSCTMDAVLMRIPHIFTQWSLATKSLGMSSKSKKPGCTRLTAYIQTLCNMSLMPDSLCMYYPSSPLQSSLSEPMGAILKLICTLHNPSGVTVK